MCVWLLVILCVIHRAAAENQTSSAGDHGTNTLIPGSSLQRLNTTTLMQSLSINTDGDLRIIVTRAERIRPNTCMDVLDPNEAASKVLEEFATF